MAKASKLIVMISSRCNDRFPRRKKGGQKLSDIRKNLKKEIEKLKVFGRSVFEVWINEDVDPQGGQWDSWEVCLRAVHDCDILIALSNGNAGWARQNGEIGICHAELMEGLNHAPGKVRIIDLGNIPIRKSNPGRRDQLFQEYIQRRNLFHGGRVADLQELHGRVKSALYDALVSLAQAGVRETSRGHPAEGDALSWSHLNFEDREKAMREVLRTALKDRRGSKVVKDNVVVRLARKRVLMVTHAIPAAMSVGPAKEMVGQPFLRDHDFDVDLRQEHCGGPVHIIACQRSATEAQAIKLLGFPDATVLSTPFGVLVADNIQKVQFAFIVNCYDETTTRHGVQRFFEWLSKSGEETFVAARARDRAKIVKTIMLVAPQQPGQEKKHAAPVMHSSRHPKFPPMSRPAKKKAWPTRMLPKVKPSQPVHVKRKV